MGQKLQQLAEHYYSSSDTESGIHVQVRTLAECYIRRRWVQTRHRRLKSFRTCALGPGVLDILSHA